jgi:tetratricopeptide (TPR) repeat protein
MRTWLLIFALFLGLSSLTYAQADPPHGLSEIAAYSIFTDAIRHNDHDMALQFGLWMLEAKPRKIEGVTTFRLDRQFERLIDVYITIAADEADPTEKTKELQKADDIFELTFETFTEEEIDLFHWFHQRGRFYQEYHNHLAATLQDAFNWYEKSYSEDPERFVESGDGFFVRLLISNFINRGEREKAMAMIDEIEELASPELQNELDQYREQLFDSAEERIAFFESRIVNTEGEDREMMMAGLFELYDDTGQSDKAVDMARQLYELNPDFENTRRIADIYISGGDNQSALPYLEELLELSPAESTTGKILLELAEAHQQLKNFQTARDFARRASNVSAVRGEALVRISSIYASVVSECTSGRALEFNDRAVYWLVIDYLERAMAEDASLRSLAQRRIETYRAAAPSTENIFFSDWDRGDTFSINGSIGECYAWINETTTVR